MYFQDGGHLGFPIRTILATFDLQVTSILPMKLSQLPFWFRIKFKIDFQQGCKGRFQIIMIFFLSISPVLPVKFRVNGPFCSGEVQNTFSRWQLWCIKTILAIFDLQVTLMLPTKF